MIYRFAVMWCNESKRPETVVETDDFVTATAAAIEHAERDGTCAEAYDRLRRDIVCQVALGTCEDCPRHVA